MKTMEKQPGHAIPLFHLVATYAGLIVLTILMVGMSRLPTGTVSLETFGMGTVDLHAVKVWVIMGISLTMAIITALFLMGLWYEHGMLNLVLFMSNFAFLFIFVIFTWADTSFRGEVDPSFSQSIDFKSPVKTAPAEEHGAATGEHQAPASTEPPAPAH